MLRLPVSLALAPPPPNPPGASSPPVGRSSRRRVVWSVAIVLPVASHSSRTEPNELIGTRYENGSVICVTVKYWPSSEASTDRIIRGWPIFRTAFDFTSMSASWPVVWYLRSALSCGSSSRLLCTG